MSNADRLERALRHLLNVSEGEELHFVEADVANMPALRKRLQDLGEPDAPNDVSLLFPALDEFSDWQYRNDWIHIQAFLHVFSCVPDAHALPDSEIVEITRALWGFWKQVRATEQGLPADPHSVITGIAIDPRERFAAQYLEMGADALERSIGDIFERLRRAAKRFEPIHADAHFVDSARSAEWAAFEPVLEQLRQGVTVFGDEVAADAFAARVSFFCSRFFRGDSPPVGGDSSVVK